MTDKPKSLSDRLGWAAIIASVLVPVVGGYVGGTYSSRLKESENDMKYIELAVSIIREDPKAETSALRNWAVAVLASRSIIPLPKKAQDELRENRVRLGYVYSSTYDTGTTIDYGQFNSTTFPDRVTGRAATLPANPTASSAK